MNEEGIKQVEFRLKKLRNWKKKADELQRDVTNDNGLIDVGKAEKWNELKDKQETLRALLYEDFENLGDDMIYSTSEDYRHKLVNLMLSIFKECRR